MNDQKNIPPIPQSMQDLPRDPRGYPIPFFVMWFDGKPDFRISDMRNIYRCTLERLCMICGKPLPSDEGVFAMGPLSTINRANDEPPMHRVCAEFSAQTCPWMLRPGMKRITKPMPDGTLDAAEQNARELVQSTPGAVYSGAPEVWSLYDASHYTVEVMDNKTLMFFLGPPREMYWYRAGRRATYDEVVDALSAGAAFLRNHPTMDSPEGHKQLDDAMTELGLWLPESEA